MKTLNFYTLLIFAPVLILTGFLGFVLPDGLMSGTVSYNIFHIIFGLLGLLVIFTRRENLIRSFNIGFGLIDLYQAAANYLNWFPETYFQWKTADDYLHIIIGGTLVLIGTLGKSDKKV